MAKFPTIGVILLKLLSLLLLSTLFFIAGYSANTEAQSSKGEASKSASPSIQILVASWCVHCRDLEKFLQEENLGYIRLDIEKDPEGRKLYQQLGGGGVPVVIIGKSILKGFDKNAILELLEKTQRSPKKENSI